MRLDIFINFFAISLADIFAFLVADLLPRTAGFSAFTLLADEVILLLFELGFFAFALVAGVFFFATVLAELFGVTCFLGVEVFVLGSVLLDLGM